MSPRKPSPVLKSIPYGRQSIDSKDAAAVIAALFSERITQGPKVEEFERNLAKYCGAMYAVAVNSGTSALHLACLAAGLGPGDEGVTSPITFLATPNALLYCGAKPVFADIKETDGNIDPKALPSKINSRTKALLPVHYAGLPADMKEIAKIASKKKLAVIEDACHALGATYNGKKVGSCEYSDMTVFSFHPVKHITTGEGGAITTNDKKLYRRLLMLRSHGMVRTEELTEKHGGWFYEMETLGFNYRITDMQCALGISQLDKLSVFLKKREHVAQFYNEVFEDIQDRIKLPQGNYLNKTHAWHLYPLRLLGSKPARRDLFDFLRRQNIEPQVHYIPVHLQPYYRKTLKSAPGDCPKAESFYASEISLPIFPGLKKSELDHVARSVLKGLSR